MQNPVTEIYIPDLKDESAAELSGLLPDDVRVIEPTGESKEGREVATLTAVVVVSLVALIAIPISIVQL